MSTRVIVPALFLAASGASASIIDVQTFGASDWYQTTFQFGPFGGSGESGPSTQGQTGDGWYIRNSCGPSYSGAWNLCTYNAFTYDPSVGGPLTDLSFSIDSRYEDYLQAIGFVVEQGGNFWVVGYWINTPSWTTYTLANPANTDFAPLSTSQPPLPDFSASGAPIHFGFGSANSSAGGWGYTTLGYYDNFSVNFVPAPGAMAILALAGVASRRRR